MALLSCVLLQALVRQRIQQRAAAATAEKVENIILNALLGT